ncbi:MAG: PAS-domain containing protein [Proteobacteria bacterium]|nr:PAS-domain containing protein [Pseudomonadota bacterium]
MAPCRTQPRLIHLALATSLLPPTVLIAWDMLRGGAGSADLPTLGLGLALLGLCMGLIMHGRDRAAKNQAETMLTAALEGSDDGYAIFDGDQRLVACNSAYRRELPVAPDPGQAATYDMALAAFERSGKITGQSDCLPGWLRRAMTAAGTPGRAAEIRHADGRWLRLSEKRLPDAGIVSILRDTTQQQLERVSAERHDADMQALLDSLDTGICLADRHGRILAANSRFASLLGCRADELRPGAAVAEAFTRIAQSGDPGNGAGERLESLGYIQALRGRPSRREWLRTDGSVIESNWVPVTTVGAALVASDLTQQRQLESSLREAKEVAEATTRTKSEFLANMSHELRTPLNAIMGFSEIRKNELFGSIGNPTYRVYASDIYDSGGHLLTLINDILDMSKAEAGKIELQETEVEVEAVIAACLRLVKARAETGGLSLSVARPETPIRLWVDERRIKQILLNLLSNAIKFTRPGGRVVIAASIERSGSFVLTVRDTGIGIAPDGIAKALAPFGQVDSKLARRFDGTGLGLPLSRVLAELHDGHLDMHSRVAVGTTIRVRLPAERVVAQTPTERPNAVSA